MEALLRKQECFHINSWEAKKKILCTIVQEKQVITYIIVGKLSKTRNTSYHSRGAEENK